MQFRTEIEIPLQAFPFTHYDKLMLLGSCFTENIGSRLEDSGFTTDINPFGVLYNPLSLASGLQDLMATKIYHEEDLFEHNGLFASFSHHSKFSSVSPEECLQKINQRMQQSSRFLKEASVLIVTFGTAFVYRLSGNGRVVSNCHKLPPSHFDRNRLSVEEIVDTWTGLLEDLHRYNPGIKVLFTVSPIRHWKDGAHGNQLSKATLLLAVDELERRLSMKDFPQLGYFPSYELVLDDLRDYRYYAEDMLHPSSVAIDYIWEKFSAFCFDRATQQQISEYRKIQQALQHRPFNPDSEASIRLKNEAQTKMEAFRKRFT